MEKLLLTIEVPSVEQVFDYTAPEHITPQQMRELLYQILAELTGGSYIPSGTEVLCRREDQRLLPMDVTLRDSGIQMGDHLLLL